jgi:hypothetical protein
MEGLRHEIDWLKAEITIAERAKEAVPMKNARLQEELHIERAQQKTVFRILSRVKVNDWPGLAVWLLYWIYVITNAFYTSIYIS